MNKEIIKTKSGFKLIMIGLGILILSLVFIVWGSIRFLLINPTKYVAGTRTRRDNKRMRKLSRLETKRQLKDLKGIKHD